MRWRFLASGDRSMGSNLRVADGSDQAPCIHRGPRKMSRSKSSRSATPPLMGDVVLLPFIYLLELLVYLRKTNSCITALASRPPVLMSVVEKTSPAPRSLFG